MSEDQEYRVWQAGADEKFRTLFRLSGEQTEALKENTEAATTLRLELAQLNATLAARAGAPCSGHAGLESRVASLEETRAEAKGGWKVIVTLMAASSTIGAVVGWAVGHMKL